MRAGSACAQAAISAYVEARFQQITQMAEANKRRVQSPVGEAHGLNRLSQQLIDVANRFHV